MDDLNEIKNQLRNASDIPPSALIKDNSYREYNSFMKDRDNFIKKKNNKKSKRN